MFVGLNEVKEGQPNSIEPLWDAALVTSSSLRGRLYSQTILGLGTEEQWVAIWFIGPRTINITLCTKGLVLS